MESIFYLLTLRGAFGSVIKASSKETGEEVAIKMIKKDDLDEEDIKNIHTEVNVSANVKTLKVKKKDRSPKRC